jgi:hypothetical protein
MLSTANPLQLALRRRTAFGGDTSSDTVGDVEALLVGAAIEPSEALRGEGDVALPLARVEPSKAIVSLS